MMHRAKQKKPSTDGKMSMNQMRQMLQQLSVMLTPNTNKSSDIISNLSQINSNINWILDLDKTYHVTRNKNLLLNYKHFKGK
jgi:hypothetical protein